MLPALVNQPVVDLVADHEDLIPGQGGDVLHDLRFQEVAGWIGGGVDDDGAGPRAQPFLYLPRAVLEAVLLEDRDLHRPPVHELHDVRIAGVAGVGEDDLVPGVQEGGEEEEHGRGAPAGDDDAVRVHLHVVLAVVVGGDGLPQLPHPLAVGVAGLSLQHGPVGSLLYAAWGVEVRFPHLHVHDVPSLPLHLLGPFQDLHDHEGRDALSPSGDHHAPFLSPGWENGSQNDLPGSAILHRAVTVGRALSRAAPPFPPPAPPSPEHKTRSVPAQPASTGSTHYRTWERRGFRQLVGSGRSHLAWDGLPGNPSPRHPLSVDFEGGMELGF